MFTALGRHIEIRGIVQGVGFRPWVYRLATEQGLGGRVRNDATGVTIEVFGSEGAIDLFMRRLEGAPPPAAEIGELRSCPIPAETSESFSIVQSQETAERRVSIPPDLATCPACLREIFDPADRRYRYPFTNCTNCGPRFTIARDVPYDRPATTMAAFDDVSGMPTRVRGRRRSPVPRPAERVPGLRAAARRCMTPRRRRDQSTEIRLPRLRRRSRPVRSSRSKGSAGFISHVTRRRREAVQRLRARKRRDEKPFAVMVRDLGEADELPVSPSEERRLLASVERPIVLATRREECGRGAGGRPQQSAGRAAAAVHAAASRADARRPVAAGDDVGQPVRGASRVSER